MSDWTTAPETWPDRAIGTRLAPFALRRFMQSCRRRTIVNVSFRRRLRRYGDRGRQHLAILLWAALLPGAAGHAQPEAQPVFRVGVSLIVTDVTVTDAEGRPVVDLRRDEFIVEQDGKRQTLRDVQYIQTSSGTGLPGASVHELRNWILVVDDANMRIDSALRLREALPQVLRAAWQPGDRGVLMRTAPGAPSHYRPTATVKELIEEAGHISTLGPVMRPALRSEECEYRLPADPFEGPVVTGTLAPVEAALASLLPNPNRRTLIFLFADGVFGFRCPHERSSASERLRRLADRANRGNAVVFGLHPEGLSSGVIMPEARGPDATAARGAPAATVALMGVSSWLKSLSEMTGGFAVRANDIQATVSRAVNQQQGYYLLTYEPPPHTFDGDRPRYRRINVACTRSGMKVRGRSGFYNVQDRRPAG